MDLIGVKVKHNTFGEGEIKSFSKSGNGVYLSVNVIYSDCEISHDYPNCFYDKKNPMDIIDNAKAKEMIDYDYKLYKFEIKLKSELKSQRRKGLESQRGNAEINDEKNIAFKCVYCDGGATPDYIGFNGPCSDEIRTLNIGRRHPNCIRANHPCQKYENGQIDKEQLKEEFSRNSKDICYECHLMDSWYYGSGFTQNGRPIKIDRNVTNALCVLTTYHPSERTEDIHIIGVYIIDSFEKGDDYNESKVFAHQDYRIRLTKNEVKKMPFWQERYYQNRNTDADIWGTGHRYLINPNALNILEDIKSFRNDPKEVKLIEEMILYYKYMNLDSSEKNLNELARLIIERKYSK